MFADNSPIVKVDVNGGDGIIYLIILPGARGRVNPKLIVQHANEIAAKIGLNVQVKIFDYGDAVNQDFLDATDNYVVIGATSFEVEEYFKKNNLGLGYMSQFFRKNKDTVQNAKNSGTIIEDGFVVGEASKKLQTAGLSVAGAESLRTRQLTQEGNEKIRNFSLEELLGLEILHEAGHNITRLRHTVSDRDVGFMKDGLFYDSEGIDDVIESELNQEIVPLYNKQMQDVKVNLDFLNIIKNGVIEDSDRVPTDNYEENKKNRG